MRFTHLPVLLLSGLFLVSCSAPPDMPSIRFIGVSKGTLETDAEEMEFADRFEPSDQTIIGVVVFDEPGNGTRVQATWFSPDERRMPLGRTSIEMASGATVARFSFASQEPWNPAPYLLRIDAYQGEGASMRTESGSVAFYIGMEQHEIDSYLREFDAWKKVDEEKRAAYEERARREQAIVDAGEAALGAENGFLMLQHDLNGDGQEEYLIGTLSHADMMPSMGGGPGVLAAGEVDQFIVQTASGTELLSLRVARRARVVRAGEMTIVERVPGDGPAHLSVLASRTFVLAWEENGTSCALEIRPDEHAIYHSTQPVCTSLP